jgi:hypothetical protein
VIFQQDPRLAVRCVQGFTLAMAVVLEQDGMAAVLMMNTFDPAAIISVASSQLIRLNLLLPRLWGLRSLLESQFTRFIGYLIRLGAAGQTNLNKLFMFE